METATLWYLIIGALLVLVAVLSSVLERLPLTTSVVYIVIGFLLGPEGLGLVPRDAFLHTVFLEHLSELVVIVACFSAGLSLRIPLRDPTWNKSIRLASVSMIITIGLLAAVSHFLFSLPWGLGILLGAILAPTDPVLASNVQLESPHDRDRLRFSLTAEAGMNDGSAFPFVMLGLGLLGLHDLGSYGLHWIIKDIVWAIAGGLFVGALSGWFAAMYVTRLRSRSREAVILDDFLCFGVITFSYGVALAIGTYGFLAVFAAGLAMRQYERITSERESQREKLFRIKPQHDNEPARMTGALLNFNQQVERFGEVATVLLLGGMLRISYFKEPLLWLAPILFCLIRPISVWLGLLGSNPNRLQMRFAAWFGIRGIGSIYYLMFAINHGLSTEYARLLETTVYSIVTISVIVHGLSVTPLMTRYERLLPSKRKRRASASV